MLDDNFAFELLKVAIRSVDNDYIQINYEEKVKDNDLQPERTFAYELHKQWSLLCEIPSKISGEKLVLSGEITKHFKPNGGTISPDLVLHGGQIDNKSQLVVCEIKRQLKNNVTSKRAILKDFIKLHYFLNLKRHIVNGETDENAGYRKGVFIALNTAQETMKHYISALFNDFDNIKIERKFLEGTTKDQLKAALREEASRIECITVEPKGSYPDVKSFTLSQIFSQNNNSIK